MTPRNRNITLSIIALALMVRLLAAAAGDPDTTFYWNSGDQIWYLANGLALFNGEGTGEIYGFQYDISVIPTAPLYLVFIGFWQAIFPADVALRIIWVIQAIAGAMTCFFIFRIAYRLGEDARVGWVAALAWAIYPPSVREAALIFTEPLYIFFIIGGLWLYIDKVLLPASRYKWRWCVGVGILLGLATLTRAVALLFPIGIIVHILFAQGRGQWRSSLALGAILLVSYGAVASTWTWYNWVNHDRFVVASTELTATLWRGAVPESSSPQDNDRLLGDETPVEQASRIIVSDPTAYARYRLTDLIGAYLQPHGVDTMGRNANLRQSAIDWLQSGLQWDQFVRLINGDAFWPQMLTYGLHFLGLLGGLIGMGLAYRHWRVGLVLIGFIAYTTLVHLILLALPRYIYPTYPAYWAFAAFSLIALWDALRPKTPKPTP